MTAGATRSLLARMLEQSSLVTRVRELDARTLCRVIRRIGLEDAGEIVALASTQQLRDVFDEDLWRSSRPGRGETFDADRFALWLEILLDSGEAFVADKLTELPEDLVTLGVQRQVLVIDLDALAMEMVDRHQDVDLIEKSLDSCLYEEIDEYRVIARRHEHWDAIIAVLLALDQQHHDYLHRVLERCCHASTEYIEDNGGLYEVLSAEEVLASDAAAERDDRRGSAGFVAPLDAASFLGLVRVTSLEEVLSSDGRDPVTRAHFRSVATKPRPGPGAAVSIADEGDRARFSQLLQEEGVFEAPPVALLSGSQSDAGGAFQRAVASLRPACDEVYDQRMEELAYLTNVLVAGSSLAGRPFRPVEAAEAAIAIGNLGLEHQVSASRRQPDAIVREVPADKLFRIGWHLLFRGISMPVARQLENMLCFDETLASEPLLSSVRRAIQDQKPWRTLPLLANLAVQWPQDRCVLFEHLLDRCPTLPTPHCSAGRTLSFIATASEISLARRLAGIRG